MRLPASLAGVVALVLVVVVAPEATGGGGTPITSCGQTVTTSAVLTQNLICTGFGGDRRCVGDHDRPEGVHDQGEPRADYGIDD